MIRFVKFVPNSNSNQTTYLTPISTYISYLTPISPSLDWVSQVMAMQEWVIFSTMIYRWTWDRLADWRMDQVIGLRTDPHLAFRQGDRFDRSPCYIVSLAIIIQISGMNMLKNIFNVWNDIDRNQLKWPRYARRQHKLNTRSEPIMFAADPQFTAVYIPNFFDSAWFW